MTFRQIHTQIWKDDYFLELAPEEKLLFIYLFSNENTSLTGLYKISMRVICFETGLDQRFVADTLSKFEQAGKVCYENNLMWVINMRKYHETRSPTIKTAIAKDLARIPDCPLKKRYLSGDIPYAYPMHTDVYHTIPEAEEDTANTIPEPDIWKNDPSIGNGKPATTTTLTDDSVSRNLLMKVSKSTFIPEKQQSFIEAAHCMIDKYGLEKTETALTAAFNKWIRTKKKDGGGYYSALNLGWVDWAQESLLEIEPPASKNYYEGWELH